MASHKEKKNLAKENKLLLMELPYYNCKDLKNAHLACEQALRGQAQIGELARRLMPTRSITFNWTLIYPPGNRSIYLITCMILVFFRTIP